MHHMEYHEPISHTTGSFPLAYYHVDESFPRYRMSIHWHSESEFIRIIRGKLRLMVGGTEITACAGDLLLIAPGVIHGGEPEDCVYECIVYDLRALMPSGDPSGRNFAPAVKNSIYTNRQKIDTISQFSTAIEELFRISSGNFQNCSHLLIGAIFRLIHYALSNGTTDFSSMQSTIPRSERLKPALEFIGQNYGRSISLEELAGLTGYSPKYFCRYFRSVVHRSPIDYLNFYRIERAAEFLTSEDSSVADVAMRCGFSDSSAFIKQFRRYKGTTPKQYQLSTRNDIVVY